jgi:competence protein ComEA
MKFVFLAMMAFGADKLPDGPGKATYEKICGTCHEPDVVTGMGHDKAGWKDIVDEMVDKGAAASAKERQVIIDYLAKAFPRKAS